MSTLSDWLFFIIERYIFISMETNYVLTRIFYFKQTQSKFINVCYKKKKTWPNKKF